MIWAIATILGAAQAVPPEMPRAPAARPALPLTADDFIVRADAAEAALKAVQPQMAAVSRVVRDAMVAYRADVAVAQVTGRPPRGCLPPKGGSEQLDLSKLVDAMRGMPGETRSGPLRQERTLASGRCQPGPRPSPGWFMSARCGRGSRPR